MKAHRTANLRVHTTPAKFAALFQMASACRFVWNWAVRTNRAELWAWQHSAAQAWLGTRPKASVTFFTWSKRFTRLRKNTPWLADLPYAPLRATLRRWSQSWAAYFDPKVPQDGKPKFHDRDHKLWVDFPGSSATLKGRWLRLGGIGWVRLSGSDQYAGAKVVSVHLSCEDGRKWFATIGYEVELPKPADNGLAIGVDMNCGQVATSTGYILRAPDVTRLEARRKRYQRRMARCKKGSKRREIMRQRMAKAIRRKRNIGRDWRHQVSRRLADTAGMVVIEDLQVAKMTRSAKGSLDAPGKNVAAKAGMNRTILATGWGELRRNVEYKAAHIVAVDPRNTSRKCHECGHVDKGNRTTQADFKCLACGHAGNADVNAALNVMARGIGASGRRPAFALATGATRQPSSRAMAA